MILRSYVSSRNRVLGLPKEAEARALLHSSSGTNMGYEVHLYSCVSPESFPAIQGLFSPYSYYLKMQFILLNLAVNGPVKKNFKHILTNLTIALKSPSRKAVLAMKLPHLQTFQCRYSSQQVGCDMRESTLWGDFIENPAWRRLQITAVVWEPKVKSSICITLSLLRDAIYTCYCWSWTRWMESQMTHHNSKPDHS